MRKFIILLLAIATTVFAQETAFTTKGKKVTLNKDFTWSYIESTTLEGFDFRKTNWGMSKEDVEASETFDKYGDKSDGFLMYKGSVSELECVVIYFFTNNMLTGGRYFFTEEHSNKNDFLSDYSSMKELLTKKYGDPEDDEEWWRNDLYKDDYQSWGMAIGMGHYIQYATWKKDKTSIEISLTGENYSITHKIDYISIELKDLYDSVKTTEALEEL